jgi:hypothetical protein
VAQTKAALQAQEEEEAERWDEKEHIYIYIYICIIPLSIYLSTLRRDNPKAIAGQLKALVAEVVAWQRATSLTQEE